MTVSTRWDKERREREIRSLLPDLWAAWGKLLDAASQVPEPPRRDFCWTCAGTKRFWEPAGNGEGWISFPCPTCGGSGVA